MDSWYFNYRKNLKIRDRSTARKNKKCFLLVYTVCFVRWDTYYLTNRVEHQKLIQPTAELPFGRVFGIQLDLPDNKCPI